MLSVDDVNAILRLPLLGVIADEPEIIITTNRGEPLALRKDATTGAAYHAIAARIAGEDVAAPSRSSAKSRSSDKSARSSEGSAHDRISQEALRQRAARAVRPRKNGCAWC